MNNTATTTGATMTTQAETEEVFEAFMIQAVTGLTQGTYELDCQYGFLQIEVEASGRWTCRTEDDTLVMMGVPARIVAA